MQQAGDNSGKFANRGGGSKYKRVFDPVVQDQLIRDVFDAEAWLRYFESYCAQPNRDGIRAMRCDASFSNVRAFVNLFYLKEC